MLGVNQETLTSESLKEGRLAVLFCLIASKRFLITEQWTSQTKITLEMKRTFLVINYQTSDSQTLCISFTPWQGGLSLQNPRALFVLLVSLRKKVKISQLLWEQLKRGTCIEAKKKDLLLKLHNRCILAVMPGAELVTAGTLREVCMKSLTKSEKMFLVSEPFRNSRRNLQNSSVRGRNCFIQMQGGKHSSLKKGEANQEKCSSGRGAPWAVWYGPWRRHARENSSAVFR